MRFEDYWCPQEGITSRTHRDRDCGEFHVQPIDDMNARRENFEKYVAKKAKQVIDA